jgi:hypothetical protein
MAELEKLGQKFRVALRISKGVCVCVCLCVYLIPRCTAHL